MCNIVENQTTEKVNLFNVRTGLLDRQDGRDFVAQVGSMYGSGFPVGLTKRLLFMY